MITVQTIQVSDIPDLRGRYVIRLNRDDHDIQVSKNIGFYAEKRISVVTVIEVRGEGKRSDTKYLFSGLYYPHSDLLSEEEFVEKFNSEGEDRYYRLMTKDEVDALTEHVFSKSRFVI